MSKPSTDAILRSAIDHVVNPFYEVLQVTDLVKRADINTRVPVLVERGTTDEVGMIAKLLEGNDQTERSSDQ